jgi:hypothetical protein
MLGDPPTIAPHRAWSPSRLMAAMAGTVFVAAAFGVAVGFATRPVSRAPTLVPTAPNPSTARASALYDRALATVAASTGFHYIAVFSGTETIIGDAGRSVGQQVVTFKSTYGLEAFMLLLGTNGTLYFQGNAAALEDQLGVTRTKTSSVVNRWVSLSSTDGPYAELAAGMTVAEQSIFVPLIPTSTSSVRFDGRNATQISGTVTAADDPASTARLDIDMRSLTPIEYASTTSSSGGPLSSTIAFSAWGQLVAVKAPSSAIAWSTIGAVPPPAGYGSG